MVHKFSTQKFEITPSKRLCDAQLFDVFSVLSLSLNTELKALNVVIMHPHKNIGQNVVTGLHDALLKVVFVTDFLSIHQVF